MKQIQKFKYQNMRCMQDCTPTEIHLYFDVMGPLRHHSHLTLHSGTALTSCPPAHHPQSHSSRLSSSPLHCTLIHTRPSTPLRTTTTTPLCSNPTYLHPTFTALLGKAIIFKFWPWTVELTPSSPSKCELLLTVQVSV